jgi:hypothetical protein
MAVPLKERMERRASECAAPRDGPQGRREGGLLLPQALRGERLQGVSKGTRDAIHRGTQGREIAWCKGSVRRLKALGEAFAFPALRTHDRKPVRPSRPGKAVKGLPQFSQGATLAGRDAREQAAQVRDAQGGVGQILTAECAKLFREAIVRVGRHFVLPLKPESRYALR